MIILLGFPKSGTTSFQHLFVSLGYTSYHWKKGEHPIGTLIKNNKKYNRPLLCNFKQTDCITQMDICTDISNAYWPQLTDYEQLYYENSDSVFILNKRNPTKMLASFKKWSALNERMYAYNPEILYNNTDNALLELYNRHYTNIETFFALHPTAKFISFDIENDSIERLGKYIDLKGIKLLPRENVNGPSPPV
jgi:hypothetical protein